MSSKKNEIVSKTIFINEGDKCFVRDVVPMANDLTVKPKAAIYSAREDMEKGPHLVLQSSQFTLPKVIYGDHLTRHDMIYGSFKKRKGATGVLLHGLKGTGKTLLAQALCNSAINDGIPVIFVPADEHVPAYLLKYFIKRLGKCVVFMDEFAKNYSEEKEQNNFLNLFCDSELEKVMFIIVDNEKEKVNNYMIDRPGRFLFRIAYEGIDRAIALEMGDARNLSIPFQQELIDYVEHHQLSMDVVQTFVDIAAQAKTIEELYSLSSLYNIPAINGWSFGWKWTYKDREDRPRVDLIADVSNHSTRFKGKFVLDENNYPLDIDLSQFEGHEIVHGGRLAYSYAFEVGPVVLTIVRYRSSAADQTIYHTAKSASLAITQQEIKPDDNPRGFGDSPKKAVTVVKFPELESGTAFTNESCKNKAKSKSSSGSANFIDVHELLEKTPKH